MKSVTTEEDINNRFAYHAPNENKVTLHEDIREECRILAHTLNERMPASREASLAMTKLEECMFWANAAIARNSIEPE